MFTLAVTMSKYKELQKLGKIVKAENHVSYSSLLSNTCRAPVR